jgi:pimeloyl-ACP methyl ester carboxylesterase
MTTPKRVRYFHSSPGNISEIQLLKTKLSADFQFISTPRNITTKILSEQPCEIFIAYSWGCSEALKFLLLVNQAQLPKKIYFVSPYLFSPPISGLKKILLKCPFINRLIISIIKKQALQKFLEKSCYPKSIPNEMVSWCHQTIGSVELIQSVLEKDHEPLSANLIPSSKNIIDVVVIHGELDQTSDFQTQIAPLTSFFPHVRFFKIPDAGHALIWTDPEKIIEQIIEQQLPNTPEISNSQRSL